MHDEYVRDELANILARTPVGSVAAAIEIIGAIDSILPNSDGLKWFNFLYLRVSESIEHELRRHDITWHDSAWMSKLDILFANLYFEAFSRATRNIREVPAAWRPLFDARFARDRHKLQFALAGMNAHINRDLPIAIERAYEVESPGPSQGDPRYADYLAINPIIDHVQDQVKQQFLEGLLRTVDGSLGRIDDIISMWSIHVARESAWTRAELLWQLRSTHELHDSTLFLIDRTTGMAGRGLLIPVL